METKVGANPRGSMRIRGGASSGMMPRSSRIASGVDKRGKVAYAFTDAATGLVGALDDVLGVVGLVDVRARGVGLEEARLP
jgi:hypothetical protein